MNDPIKRMNDVIDSFTRVIELIKNDSQLEQIMKDNLIIYIEKGRDGAMKQKMKLKKKYNL